MLKKNTKYSIKYTKASLIYALNMEFIDDRYRAKCALLLVPLLREFIAFELNIVSTLSSKVSFILNIAAEWCSSLQVHYGFSQTKS